MCPSQFTLWARDPEDHEQDEEMRLLCNREDGHTGPHRCRISWHDTEADSQ